VHQYAAALLATISISVSCSDSAPTAPTAAEPPPIPAIRVSGRVIDYHSGQSVAGTSITWRERSSSSSARQTVTSDAAGRFEVALPIADTFSFEIKREPGPVATIDNPVLQSGIVRVPGKWLETDLLVNPGPCAVRYGYVFDAVTRQPIAGARVNRAGTASTDANGYYRIEIVCDAPPGQSWGIGTTTISASHPAYQGTYELDGRIEWTGRPGITRVDFALQPLGQ
jgi:hypothetical protein